MGFWERCSELAACCARLTAWVRCPGTNTAGKGVCLRVDQGRELPMGTVRVKECMRASRCFGGVSCL